MTQWRLNLIILCSIVAYTDVFLSAHSTSNLKTGWHVKQVGMLNRLAGK